MPYIFKNIGHFILYIPSEQRDIKKDKKIYNNSTNF